MIDFAVIGGGAAGVFGALCFAEANPQGRIVLLERSSRLLSKVKVSGGGRCNVTHACYEPAELVKHYPRGARELRGAFHRFGPKEMIQWLDQRRIRLKTEADGRMFPISDDSQTIIDCFLDEAARKGCELRTKCAVNTLHKNGTHFVLELADGNTLEARNVLLATGGGNGAGGLALAQSLGHSLTPIAPSLFTFKIKDPRLEGLSGISVPHAHVSLSKKQRQSGPLLITHWGLSGPAVLRLSAWEARNLQACDYRFEVSVDWTGGAHTAESCAQALDTQRGQSPKKLIRNTPMFGLPARLWERLLHTAGVAEDTPWAQLKRTHVQALCAEVCAGCFNVTGKSTHKEEFVTCGGVDLREVDFKSFESKRCPGLYFAGEVLDVDGITGGFNFQAAWTGAYHAATAAAARNED